MRAILMKTGGSPARVCLALACLACVLLAVSCTTPKKDKNQARAHYKLGLSYLIGEQYQPAFLEFQKSIKLNPDDPEVNNAIGIVYLRLEELKNSEDYFLRAVKLDAEYSDALNNLCFIYSQTARERQAIAACERALKNPLYKNPERSYFNLGRIHYAAGRYQESIASYRNAVKRAPSFVPAFYGLAVAFNAAQEYGKAADAMTRAIELDPRFKGDRDEAERQFNDALMKAEDRTTAKDFSDYLEILKY